ncbi:transposase [Mesorhizobium sp. M6A.T.Cr.TU.017.01.1.1]|uniref:transposase n=1 Tax=Mesorhizobium sp. M6A.T.Cr.TU.017.01.1.1 TaxID=2496774 RepID=UPI001FDF51F0|nr:transposase [Mesorhizobium sp. M6A.T.Cr.TU.017.01.1.1]
MLRRRWSAEAKARIVEEALAPGPNVSTVARTHRVSSQQAFAGDEVHAEGLRFCRQEGIYARDCVEISRSMGNWTGQVGSISPRSPTVSWR